MSTPKPDPPPIRTRPRKRTLLASVLLLVALFAAGVWGLRRVMPDADVLPLPPDAASDLFDAQPPTLAERVADSTDFEDGVSAFAVEVGEWTIPYRVFGLFVAPGDTLGIRPLSVTQPGGAWHVSAQSGALAQTGDDVWTWTAPTDPGPYPIRVADTSTGEFVTLHAFVGVPFDHSTDALDGYRIGAYADHDGPVNQKPPLFVRLTPDVADVAVSPHFTVGQFVAKQVSDYPKYLVMSTRLLLKLEGLLQAANEAGISARTFTVMSGYRTPHYNRSIGNTTTLSRHLFGDGADIFIDDDGDGQMDDLDGDGQITEADARVLASLVEAQSDADWYQPFIGGLGIYGPAPHRGPFIHVDTRGTAVRW